MVASLFPWILGAAFGPRLRRWDTVARCSHGTWWINRPALLGPTWGQFWMILQSRETFTSLSEPASECFCEHLRQTPRDFTLYLSLALAPLKRRSAPRDTRAPRALTIVGSFSQQPSQEFVADSVAALVCPLVLAAARASPAALREGATSVIIGAPPLQMS
jgi:hypothetical protein